MKRIFLVMTIVLFGYGCASIEPLSEECGGTSGFRATKITYGDSQISVNPKALGKQNRELQFRLDPKSKGTDLINYDDVVVTVTGKDDTADWISGSSKASTSRYFLGGCVPKDAAPGTVYTYEIKVENVGTLDPRVEVTF